MTPGPEPVLLWLDTFTRSFAPDSAAYAGPVVGLEPSCAAALRDDAVKLLESEAAHRRTCAEQSFLPYLARRRGDRRADGFSCRLQIAELGGEALGPRRPLHLATLLRRAMAL
ncbi:MAG: hypothetical protein H0U51_01880 [Propionibacteriales bacterium]|nr:hypothetical protein [Propionibacteriales bacterium]